MMKQNLSFPGNLEIIQYFKSRLLPTKLAVFIFVGLIVLFITSQISFSQSASKLPKIIVFENNSLVSKLGSARRYLYNLYQNSSSDSMGEIIDKAQPPATCLILIRTVDGGIGSWMFLFASAYGLARLHQCDLYVAPSILQDLRSIFVVNITNTPVHLVTNDLMLNKTGIFQRRSACTLYDDLLKVPLSPSLTTYEMTGFYQAYGYFYRYKDEISYLFQFQQYVMEKNVALVERLVKAVWNIPLDLGTYTKDNVPHQYLKSILARPPAPLIPVTWIGIHIRRGDFLTVFKLDTNLKYLNFAMNYYQEKYINCRFLMASDDKAYVKTHFGSRSDVFITPDDFFSGNDLGALALCEHSIVTAGAYGWWAAWLADGDVVHDPNYPVASQQCMRDCYFPPWFLLPFDTFN